MQVHGGRRHLAKGTIAVLRQKPYHQARENIARPTGRHAGIACGINPDLSVR